MSPETERRSLAAGASRRELQGKTLIFFDGVCVFCSGVVRFLLPRDPGDLFRFGALQDPFAMEALPPLGMDPAKLEGFAVVTDYAKPRQRLWRKAPAALVLARQLGGGWRLLGALARPFPERLLNWAYTFVAERRYRWFGKRETCYLPSPEDRRKFLDGEPGGRPG